MYAAPQHTREPAGAPTQQIFFEVTDGTGSLTNRTSQAVRSQIDGEAP